MGLFSTSASNEAENQAWLANLRATRPDAAKAYERYLQLTIASQNDPGEGGSATAAGRRRMRQAIGYSPQALEEARRVVETQYPDVMSYAREHGQRTGGLGQGGDVLVASVAFPAAAAYLAPAAGAGSAGTTAGTGAATGTAAGTTAGTAAGTTTGTAAGTGAGTSLTDAAIETGISGGLGSSGGSSTGTSAGTGAGTAAGSGGFWDSLGNWVSSPTGQGLLNLGAGYIQGEQNQQAANTYAQAQLEAARLAAEEARFRPIGVTTRFGQSQFGYDDKGRLTSAGYTLAPELKAQQDALMGAITGNQGMMQPQNRPIAGARANGGPVAGGQTYLVGENGPEPYNSPYGSTIVGQNGPTLFTPPANGAITPNIIGNAIANQQGRMYAGGTPGFYSGGQNQTNPSSTTYQGIASNPNTSSIGSPLNPNISSNVGVISPNSVGAVPISSGSTNRNWIGAPELNPNNRQIQSVYTGGITTNTNQQQGGLLGQAVGAQQTTAPMSQGAQSLFNLGQGYLASTPQEQASRYMQEQQSLLSPSRERGLAQLQNQMYQQGRTGLAVGATDTMGAANPELEAFYNAQRQQDLALAAQATQGGQQYAQFGAGLLGTGGEMLRGMYNTQTAAYNPYQTALGLTQNIEGMGQNAMDIGINLGARGSASGAQAGQFLQTGASNAAEAQLPANQYNPWVGLLQGAANWY